MCGDVRQAPELPVRNKAFSKQQRLSRVSREPTSIQSDAMITCTLQRQEERGGRDHLREKGPSVGRQRQGHEHACHQTDAGSVGRFEVLLTGVGKGKDREDKGEADICREIMRGS